MVREATKRRGFSKIVEWCWRRVATKSRTDEEIAWYSRFSDGGAKGEEKKMAAPIGMR